MDIPPDSPLRDPSPTFQNGCEPVAAPREATEETPDVFPDVQPGLPLPWKQCGADRGGCICHQFWSIEADCLVGVAMSHKDEDYTLGEGATLEATALNAAYIVAACNAYPRLRAALLRVQTERDEARAEATKLRDEDYGRGLRTEQGGYTLPWEAPLTTTTDAPCNFTNTLGSPGGEETKP